MGEGRDKRAVFLFLPLQEKLAQYLTPKQIKPIIQAFLLAADAHESQFRTSGEPYITHPLAVAGILADLRMDAETITASLLHDVLEDTDYTQKALAKEFGNKVAELVNGVTKLEKIEHASKAEAQAENFRKMLLAMIEDIRVIIIKLADRYHNMQTLGALRVDKRRRIAMETLEIYAPIANRLGMHGFRNEFQDLGFQALYPLRYKILKKYVAQARGHRRRLFDKILNMLEKRLLDNHIETTSIEGRTKRLYSIYRKMHLKGLPFSEIMDVYAYRIIGRDRDDCYRILGLVHNLFKPVPGRFKDYIAIPKSNGYQSLHTTLFGPHGVPIEIQIRTPEMDNMARNGIAAHWLYKSDEFVSATEVKTKEWLQQVLDMQRHAGSSLDFIENVKIDLYPDEVYVFTPQGDIMELPRDATPIDFAYAVHTEVGDHCAGAKVNRRKVPLSYTLTNGETVEVVTQATAQPRRSWLNFVVSGKAKGAIKHALKLQHNRGAIELGRQLLTAALKEHDIKLEKLSSQLMRHLLADLGVRNFDQLLMKLGLGERSNAVVAAQIASLKKRKSVPLPVTSTAVNITGTEGVNLQFAECCYPIPGDKIVGIVRKGEGIEVHADDCARLKNLYVHLPQSAIINLQWSDKVAISLKTKIRLELHNQKGVLAILTATIADHDADICDMTISETEENYAVISLVLLVKDRQHLARILRSFKRMKYVLRAFRVKSGIGV